MQIIKVKIWNKYRKCDLLSVRGNRVYVRIHMQDLVQGLGEEHAVPLRCVRQADHDVCLSLYPHVAHPHLVTFVKQVLFTDHTPHTTIRAGKTLTTNNLTIEGNCVILASKKYRERRVPLECVEITPVESEMIA